MPDHHGEPYTFFVHDLVIAGYAFSAWLYLMAWFRPASPTNQGLVQWVTFTKLCLTEFLSLHAATLLGALVFAGAMDKNDQEFRIVFWVLLAFYFVLALGASLFHRNRRAMLGLFQLLVVRGLQLFTLNSGDADVMRSEVIKNFAMTVPMFVLIGTVTMSDDMLTPWQESFGRSQTLGQKLWRGKPLLITAAYYLLWFYVEWKWPERMSG